MNARATVALSCCFVAVIILTAAERSRTSRRIEELRTALDSARIELDREHQLLRAGHEIPALLVGAPADPRPLAALEPRFRYVYLYRDDCTACRILEEVWENVPAARFDSIAFVAFHPTDTLPEPSMRNHFRALPPRPQLRMIKGVPTFLVRGEADRVVNAAHGILEMKYMLDLYGIVRSEEVDSAVAGYARTAQVGSRQ